MSTPALTPSVSARRRLAVPARAAAHLRFWAGIGAVFVLTMVVVLTLWVVVPVVAFAWEPNAVTSGSMRPTIGPGDVVVLEQPDGTRLGPGTVIRFRAPADEAETLHRIHGVEAAGYRTRGDAVGHDDTDVVNPGAVDGVGRIVVPLIGAPAHWADQGGWLRVVALGGVLVGLLWIARWGLTDDYDPWRRAGAAASGLVDAAGELGRDGAVQRVQRAP